MSMVAAISAGPAQCTDRTNGRSGTPVLNIRAIRKTYDQLEAIRSVSFDVAQGEFVSLLGPSGCGKSTLLMMIAGLTRATEGEVKLNGARVTGPRRETGVVFQSP